MNILLLHAYSRHNKGDAAILSVMLKDLKEKYPESFFEISTMDNIQQDPEFEGVPQITSLFHAIAYKPGVAFIKIIRLLYLPVAVFIWALGHSIFGWNLNMLLPCELEGFMRGYVRSDMVIGVGGGYINGYGNAKSTIGLCITLYEFWFASFFKKPIILYAQSIGPFANSFQKFLARAVLNKVQTIFVREYVSERLLKDMGVKSHIEFMNDAAFKFVSLEKQNMKLELQSMGISFIKTRIGITVRKWLKVEEQLKFEKVMAEFANYLVSEKKAQVVFIPQVTSELHNDDDRDVQRRIIAMSKSMNGMWSLEKEYDHYQIKGIIENMDFLIGTRMHSVIFAITSNVPVLAIEYEPKTSGIMSTLNKENAVLEIGKFNLAEICACFEKLFNVS